MRQHGFAVDVPAVEADHGPPIISPCRIHEFREPILVSALGFQEEIVRQIRHDLGSNRLVLPGRSPPA